MLVDNNALRATAKKRRTIERRSIGAEVAAQISKNRRSKTNGELTRVRCKLAEDSRGVVNKPAVGRNGTGERNNEGTRPDGRARVVGG